MNKTKIEDIVKFDSAGNMITKPPKIVELEEELDNIINGKKNVVCSYCGKIWKSELSKLRHETWCRKNPNRRASHWNTPPANAKKKPKKPKTPKTPKGKIGRPPKKIVLHQWEEFSIDDLRNIDKVFGLTDKQLIEYIRGIKK